MARSASPPILSELRSPTTQIKALRYLKNEIIGHEAKKQYWVRWGILRHLVRVLDAHKDGYFNDEEAALQAVIILGSISNGGPAFIAPLHASNTWPTLFRLLSPEVQNSRILLQTLRTLNGAASSICLSTQARVAENFNNVLYTAENLRNLARLLSKEHIFGHGLPQVEIIASLIAKSSPEEYQKTRLDESGLLESLVGHLRTFIVANHFQHNEDMFSMEPQKLIGEITANDRTRISSVLYALGTIINFSHDRGQRLLMLCDDAFTCIDRQLRDTWDQMLEKFPASERSRLPASPSYADILLPQMPSSSNRSLLSHGTGHPPLDPIRTADKPFSRSLSTAVEIFSSRGLEHLGHLDSPLVPWLIAAARTSDTLISLSSIFLLATLYQLRLVKKSHEQCIYLLTVPSLVRLLDIPKTSSSESRPCLSDYLIGDAPVMLAKLISFSSRAQKAAVDSGAVKKLAQILKYSYDPVSSSGATALWSSDPSDTRKPFVEEDGAQVGPEGVLPTTWYIMRVRESTLTALAGLAADKDEYRKSIIDSGVIPFVVRALKAEDVSFSQAAKQSDADKMSIDQKLTSLGSRQTVAAACGTARALSRSVATLRTSLMDAGLVEPLFALVQCQDTSLKVQATAVISNLVLEFSPMRDVIIGAGILKILFNNAHSNSPSLRVNSLWALKHLVVNASMELKSHCIEGLGVSWLKQIISSDPDFLTSSRFGEAQDGNVTPLRMSTPNAAGEQVDLLNAVDDYSRESSQAPEDDGDEDTRMSESIESLNRSEDSLRNRSSRPNRPRPTLNLKDGRDTSSSNSSAENDIVRLGLEIIRNIMMGPSDSEMIDYILRQFNPDDIFRILASKLRPRSFHASSSAVTNTTNHPFRKPNEDGANKSPSPSASATIISTAHQLTRGGLQQSTHAPIEIIKSALYCLVHIAAGRARHKELVMSHQKTLELLLPLMQHPEPEVRAACCWVVHNLVWEEDRADASSSGGGGGGGSGSGNNGGLGRGGTGAGGAGAGAGGGGGAGDRAKKLVEWGFYDRLKEMERDADLNCRERARNCLQQLSMGDIR